MERWGFEKLKGIWEGVCLWRRITPSFSCNCIQTEYAFFLPSFRLRLRFASSIPSFYDSMLINSSNLGTYSCSYFVLGGDFHRLKETWKEFSPSRETSYRSREQAFFRHPVVFLCLRIRLSSSILSFYDSMQINCSDLATYWWVLTRRTYPIYGD
jgi:hypothetical protein